MSSFFHRDKDVSIRRKSKRMTVREMRKSMRMGGPGSALALSQMADPNEPPEVRNARLRAMVIDELVSTERRYLEDLYTLMIFYITPMRTHLGAENNSSSSSSTDLQIIFNQFNTVEHIFDVNTDFFSDLTEKIRSEPQTCIGSTFGVFSEKLEHYAIFCIHQEEATNKTRELINKTSSFRALIQKCRESTRSQLDLFDFLIKPFQRVLKYPLLLREMLKYTPPLHPDFEGTTEAIHKFELVIQQINSSKTHSDNLKKILAINSQIVSSTKDVSLVHPSRKFIYEGPLKKIDRNSLQPRHCILFSDVFVYCKEKSPGKLVLCGLAPLLRVAVEDVPDTKEHQNVFRVAKRDSSTSSSFALLSRDAVESSTLLCCLSPVDKENWLKLLKKTTDELISEQGPQRKGTNSWQPPPISQQTQQNITPTSQQQQQQQQQQQTQSQTTSATTNTTTTQTNNNGEQQTTASLTHKQVKSSISAIVDQKRATKTPPRKQPPTPNKPISGLPPLPNAPNSTPSLTSSQKNKPLPSLTASGSGSASTRQLPSSPPPPVPQQQKKPTTVVSVNQSNNSNSNTNTNTNARPLPAPTIRSLPQIPQVAQVLDDDSDYEDDFGDDDDDDEVTTGSSCRTNIAGTNEEEEDYEEEEDADLIDILMTDAKKTEENSNTSSSITEVVDENSSNEQQQPVENVSPPISTSPQQLANQSVTTTTTTNKPIAVKPPIPTTRPKPATTPTSKEQTTTTSLASSKPLPQHSKPTTTTTTADSTQKVHQPPAIAPPLPPPTKSQSTPIEANSTSTVVSNPSPNIKHVPSKSIVNFNIRVGTLPRQQSSPAISATKPQHPPTTKAISISTSQQQQQQQYSHNHHNTNPSTRQRNVSNPNGKQSSSPRNSGQLQHSTSSTIIQEARLSDSQFEQLFHMSRSEFAKLPPDRQQRERRSKLIP